MSDGEDWESLVPPAVARIIKDIDGISRIKELTGDSPDDLKS